MKKKSVILAVVMCMFLTGCQGGKTIVDPAYDWQKEDALANAQASTPASTEESEPEETETEEPEETKTEESSHAPVQMPGELSDDLLDFQVQINGEVYQFPMWYEDFAAMGWDFGRYSDGEVTLGGQQYSVSESFEKDGLELYFSMYNYGINAVALNKCLVAGVSFDQWNMDGRDDEIILPGGIQYGVSTLEDIEAAYGTPDEQYEGSDYVSLEYFKDDDYYRSVELQVSTETGVLNSIEVKNLEDIPGIPAEAMELKTDFMPEEVSSYQTPTEMSDDLNDYVVDISGEKYQLCIPLGKMLENGWQIDGSQIEIVTAHGSEYLYLERGEERLSVNVENRWEYAVPLEYALVTGLSADSYAKPESIELAGGITYGMSEEDLVAALEGYETEVSDSSYTVYEVHLVEEYLNDYEFYVEDGKVIYIDIDYTF